MAAVLVACGQSASDPGGPAATPVYGAPGVGSAVPAPTTSTTTTAPPSSSAPPSSAPDASVPEAAAPPHQKPSECFTDLVGPIVGPDYDQFAPKMGSHCAGTQQQKIQGVEKLVFLGDSITAGTPPNGPNQIYRQIVTDGIKQRFGQNVEVGDCSRWGARDWDLLGKPNTTQTGQIQQCFPNGVENKKTLIVMTMGGNDVAAWAKDQLTAQPAMDESNTSGDQMGAALQWLKDPTHFPNGSYVIFGNVYEYTDTSGDLKSCPAAALSGFKNNWPQGAPAVVHMQEQYMKHAVETGSDMIFLLENFCGHGYRKDDPSLQCYRGPNTDLWFDLTCYHPNPTGHAKIAEYVLRVVDG